ncbi:MAG: hypothetical protein CM15mP106_0460 [Candidatus Neomarinimicrobiota bacterium]|nr:MAG: hypothetical protein CM15mP106_0460 [Candidatus Neomarinimicrobiota bacterium]
MNYDYEKIVIGTANFGMDYGIGHNQNKLIDSDIVEFSKQQKIGNRYYRYCYFLWK